MQRIYAQKLKIVVLSAFVLAFFSGFIPNEAMVSHYFWNTDGQDCKKKACQIAAAGWPVAYIWDGPHTSPAYSADWFGVLIGSDHLNAISLIKNTVFWSFVILSSLLLRKSFKRRRH